MSVSVLEVTLAAFVTALATGLGALPFAFVRTMSPRWIGVSNAIASGFMLSASGALLIEGVVRSPWRVAAGAVTGALFIAVTRRLLAGRDELQLGRLRAVDAKKAILIVTVMTVHSFSEGVGVGVSYGGGAKLGIFITIAIAIHNIPEGLAISLVLVPRGARVLAAAGWSIFSSLPQPLMAVPAYLFVEQFDALLPVGLGFAAGAMIWMAAAELLPDALAHTRRRTVALDAGLAFATMLGLQLWLI
jgi:zinc transporter ZupT